MKLLITGANGFVAGSIIAQARASWDVHGIARSGLPSVPGNASFYQFDLLDTEKLNKLFFKLKPDAVIHAAAVANIDFCQDNKTIAEKVNVGVTNTIAQLCKDNNSKLILCSTDTVFDGSKGNYAEDDSPNPVNYYAETKIKAEQIVAAASDKNIVARLSLVMGLPVIGKGNSFLADTIEKLKKGEPVKFPENEIRTPIDVITAGVALVELAGNSFGGIIHLAGNTKINRFEMAKQIALATGFSPELIAGTNSNAISGRAPRPNDASLNNSKAKYILKTKMLSLMDGLALTINNKIAKQV